MMNLCDLIPTIDEYDVLSCEPSQHIDEYLCPDGLMDQPALGYRYGFNGKEKDDEGMGGGSSTYDYGFRIYNPALGRFLSVDPLTKGFSMLTPYQYASNTPIQAIDLDGLEAINCEEAKRLIGEGVIQVTVDTYYNIFEVSHNYHGDITIVRTPILGDDNSDIKSPFNPTYWLERAEYWGNHGVWSEAAANFAKEVDPNYNITWDASQSEQYHGAGGLMNSFHHMLGQAAVLVCFGEGFAQYMGNSHERDNGVLNLPAGNEKVYFDTVSDLLNNEYAREIGTIWLAAIGGDATKATNEQVAGLMNTISAYVMEASPKFAEACTPGFDENDPIVEKVRQNIIDLAD